MADYDKHCNGKGKKRKELKPFEVMAAVVNSLGNETQCVSEALPLVDRLRGLVQHPVHLDALCERSAEVTLDVITIRQCQSPL